MKRYLGKAMVIALAVVIVTGATEAFGAGGLLNNGGQNGLQRGFAPENPQGGGGPGMPGQRPGIRGIAGDIVTVGEDRLVVKTRKGKITVLVDDNTRVVEVRSGLNPIGAKEGQRVILAGVRKDGDNVRARLITILTEKKQTVAPDAPEPGMQETPAPGGIVEG